MTCFSLNEYENFLSYNTGEMRQISLAFGCSECKRHSTGVFGSRPQQSGLCK